MPPRVGRNQSGFPLLDFFFLPVLPDFVFFFFPDFGFAATGGGALGMLDAILVDNSGSGFAAAIGEAGGGV